jgi:hypothetical protein
MSRSSNRRRHFRKRLHAFLTRIFDALNDLLDCGQFALEQCKLLFIRALWLGFQVAEFASFVSFVCVVCYFIFTHIGR